MTDRIYELADAWKLAIRREQDAHDFYMKMAHSAEDGAAREFFESLAAEELRHKTRLEKEFKHIFQPDLEEPRSRTGTFVHDLHKDAGAAGFSWWEWNDESFRLAKELDVPIVLDISASWCHWCHVMDEKTYADPQVAEIINSEFIPIRVDTDKRPDVNHRYNMGGWPTTAFLTPDGEVLTGGTYLTVPQFLQIARKVSDYYRDNKGAIQDKSEELEGDSAIAGSLPISTDELSARVMEDSVSIVLMGFDKENGGFGSEPKFPQTESLELALAEYQRTGAEQLRNIVEKTLHSMASGGMYDQVEGGFFRYSTTRDWRIPHYEKMAEDNAELLALYIHAFQVFGDEFYKNTAASIVRYLLEKLTDERGFFYSSQDADEDYYALPAASRARAKSPYIDKTPYTNYNAMLISALLQTGLVLDDRAPTDAALRAVDVIWDRHHVPGRGMAHTKGPDGEVSGLLVDQIWMAQALLDAHEFTTEPHHLQRAAELMEFVYANLHDAAGGGFYDKVDDPKALGKLRERDKVMTENAVAALVALRLHAFTGDDRHRDAAGKALAWFGETYKAYGYFASGYAMSVWAYLHEPIQAIIVGSAEDERTRDLRQAALRLHAPYRAVQVVDPQWEKERLARLGYPAQPAPRAYICVGLTCAQPTDKAQEIEGIVAPLVSPWKGRMPR